jgi:arginine/ornithine N-succinyltransferase beta subunit
MLKTVARRRALAARLARPGSAPAAANGRWQLVANGRRDGFRALLLPLDAAPDAALALAADTAAALGWDEGQSLYAAALDGAAPGLEPA